MRGKNVLIVAVLSAAVVGCNSDRKYGHKPSDHSTAKSDFDTVKDPPFTADTRFAAGQLAESQGNLQQAEAQYRETLKIDPKYSQALYRLGIIYTQTRQYDLAIECWRQYVKINNYNPTALSNLGFCYEMAGQLSEAEKAYNLGIERDPHNQACRVNYGLMLARHGRKDDAIAQLQSVLKPAEVHYNLASMYEQIGNVDEAKAEYHKALEINPRFWEASARLKQLH